MTEMALAALRSQSLVSLVGGSTGQPKENGICLRSCHARSKPFSQAVYLGPLDKEKLSRGGISRRRQGTMAGAGSEQPQSTTAQLDNARCVRATSRHYCLCWHGNAWQRAVGSPRSPPLSAPARLQYKTIHKPHHVSSRVFKVDVSLIEIGKSCQLASSLRVHVSHQIRA